MNRPIVDRETYQKWYLQNSHYSNRHVTPQWGRCHWLVPYVRGRVLEVGPQMGGCTKILATLDNVSSVVSIDITDRHIEETQRTLDILNIHNVELRKCYIEDFPEEERFDTITLWECLEHVLDDKEVLKKCHRLLNPGGSLLISVPVEDKPKEEDHLRIYTMETLGEALSVLGEPITWTCFIQEGPNKWILAHVEKGVELIPFKYGEIS